MLSIIVSSAWFLGSIFLSGYIGGAVVTTTANVRAGFGVAEKERIEKLSNEVEKIVSSRGIEFKADVTNKEVPVLSHIDYGKEVLKPLAVSTGPAAGFEALGSLAKAVWVSVKWYFKSLVSFPVFCCLTCGVWNMLNEYTPLGKNVEELKKDVREFKRKCQFREISECDWEVVHDKSKNSRKKESFLSWLGVDVNTGKLELLKQYVSYKLGLGFYHNNNVGKK